jgi:hypothetical protein
LDDENAAGTVQNFSSVCGTQAVQGGEHGWLMIRTTRYKTTNSRLLDLCVLALQRRVGIWQSWLD